MLEVFKAVKAHLKANVPGLAMLARWNNQLGNEATEVVTTFPVIYYQLDGVKTTTISKGVQQCEGILRIRHATRALRPADQDAYGLEIASYLALQNFKGGPITTSLDRVALYPDPSHGALEVVISEYRIKYTDASKLNSKVKLVDGRTLTPDIPPILFNA